MIKQTRTFLGSVIAAALVVLTPAGAVADTYWQCVPFARLVSGIQIFGDARTWWGQAVGKYETGMTPKSGAVLCFRPTERMKLGHVAVVSQVLTDRIIQITHANWSVIGGSRGQIEKDVTLVDVSPAGDWSQVKVWYDPSRNLGGSTYPTYGFIYQDAVARQKAGAKPSFENTAITVAQTAANQMAAAVRPGAGALQMLSQAADASDQIGALIAAVTGQNRDNGSN